MIEEINLSNNKDLLEEFYHFLNLENEVQETYKLNDEQIAAISLPQKTLDVEAFF